MSSNQAEIENEVDFKVKRGGKAAEFTTFKIGGPLRALLEPNSSAELSHMLLSLRQLAMPFRVLGAGSNLLVADEGVRDCVIKLTKAFRYYRNLGGAEFEVGGAMPLMTLSRELSDLGFSGLEFAGGIPASMGGAVFMNAGAHKSEISQCLKQITLMQIDGKEVTLDPKELKFSYRHSGIPPNSIVTKVQIELVQSKKEETNQTRAEFLSERKLRQPLNLPSAGSVFKNPKPDMSAGFCIEKTGLKGCKSGGAQISDLHANWIVNPERKASFQDVVTLIELAQKKVLQEFSVTLEPEIIIWR